MTINKNSVEQINVALLDIDKKIKRVNNANDLKNLEASVDGIKKTLNETTAGLESGKTYNINISGNAATATKANNAITAETATTAETANYAITAEATTKLANALTVNGKTYDGSSAVDAGVQAIANGGTGATDAASGFNALADGVRDSSTPGDNEKMLLKPAGTWYKTTCLDFWNYIKGKIKSKTVTVGDITMPASNYIEIDVGLTSSDTVISAKLSSWSSNTGAFSIICYAKNRVYIIGNAGTTITNVSVQAIYI